MKTDLSLKTINRLVQYHCILTAMEETGKDIVSSPQIAELLKIDDSQVRKDLNLLGNTGKTKVGYEVSEVKLLIEKVLGFSKTKNVFVVGTGNLGLAIAKYEDFKYYGFNIMAMFDNDPLKINLTYNDKQVFHISKLPILAKEYDVEIAVLTVPRKNAQETADFLVESGINFIWNFTPTILRVPQNIKVCNENLIGNFLQFTKDV
ncbi:redox-sensing transcriptional repressor Rex [bacterium]|nr:redox-sensing transcriptional repressor Rex [bacterium]